MFCLAEAVAEPVYPRRDEGLPQFIEVRLLARSGRRTHEIAVTNRVFSW